ncbi:MAG TPA: DedA family protein [Beijerinckia sp.]|jgi:membrane protein DedA with SNARE-associated domain|nr:DedA family protein [Beijerinckia sp.]
MPLAEHIPALISHYGYLAIFSIVALESAGIPLPGETILITAAIFAGTTHGLNILAVIGSAAAGAILGDNLGFWAGREFGLSLLLKHGHLLRLDERRLKLGQYLFLRHGGKIVFFGRFVAVLRAFAAILAGTNRLDPIRFFLFNAAGGIVWASLFGTLGYVFGGEAHRIAAPFGFALLVLAIAGAIVLWRFTRSHEERLMREAELALPGPLRSRP